MGESVEGLRVTPWADWSEWAEVKEMLENGHVREANERVQCYMTRRKNAVPIAMVTTVALRYQLKYPSSDDFTQRLSLAMAIVRFVNGMTDKLQPRGDNAYAKSVHSLAIELKLPLILVEIRHQSSHNNLPRLSALEAGALKALNWLDEYYWRTQSDKIGTDLCLNPLSVEHLRKPFAQPAPAKSTAMQSMKTTTIPKLPERASVAEQGGVLQKLRSLAEVVAKRQPQSQKLAMPDAERLKKSGDSWIDCKDRAAWRATPIGLTPGQMQAPRWIVGQVALGSENDLVTDESEASSEDPSSLQANYSGHRDFIPPIASQKRASQGQQAPLERKLAKLTSHYEAVLIDSNAVQTPEPR